MIYEWRPPFCSTCNKVGHDCAKKAPEKNKQWVPKKGGAKGQSSVPFPPGSAPVDKAPSTTNAGALPIVPVTGGNDGRIRDRV